MLVIKTFVNYDEIDEMWIHNKGPMSYANDIWEYRIEKPEGYKHYEILHKRSDGWKVLTEKALHILNNEKEI